MEHSNAWDENEIKKTIQFLSDRGVDQWMQERSREIMSLMSYYRCAMMEVETKLNVLNEEFSIRYDRNPIASIQTRLKSFPSIREKMERRSLPFSPESIEQNLTDIAGIRVICPFLDDIYLLSDCLLSQDDITLVEMKDYISHPKENGYRSLHLIIAIPIFLECGKRMMKVEVQLRTIAMDCWATLEYQLNYKKDRDTKEDIAAELLNCAYISANLDTRMNRLKQNVFGEERKEQKLL